MHSLFECDYLTTNSVLGPPASVRFVSESAKHVKFNREKLNSVADWITAEVEMGSSKRSEVFKALHVYNDIKLPLIQSLDRWFFVCSISFSFWKTFVPGEPKYMAKGPDGTLYKGSRAVMVRANQLIKSAVPFTTTSIRCMTFEDFSFFMTDRRNAVLPMIEERWAIIRATAVTLDEKFGGHFYNCIRLANFDSAQLLNLLLVNFPRYRDICEYEGHNVSCLLRAQILLLGIDQLFKEWNHKIPLQLDRNQLLISSSCRSAQMMRFYELLILSPEIEERMEKGELFTFGEPDEVEMRVMSNYCVLEIQREVNRRMQMLGKPKVSCVDIDAVINKDRKERVSALQHGQILFPKVRSVYH